MKNYKRNWKYGILYRIKRGVSISISLTFRCNYSCHYCSMQIGGKIRKCQESTLKEWLDLVDQFPYKLKEVFISGGEPTLLPYFAELCNELIRRRILVGVFTNLSNDELLNVAPSPYLRINASYHPQAKEKEFISRVTRMKSLGYQISIDEVGAKRLPIPTDVKAKLTEISQLEDDNARLRFAPDRTAYITCADLYR